MPEIKLDDPADAEAVPVGLGDPTPETVDPMRSVPESWTPDNWPGAPNHLATRFPSSRTDCVKHSSSEKPKTRKERNLDAAKAAALPPPPVEKVSIPRGSSVPRTGWFSDVPPYWEKLPESASAEADADWVHTNWPIVLERNKAGVVRINWRKAMTQAPSRGAVAWMQMAAKDERKWENDVYMKVRCRSRADDSALDRQETMQIEEIERVLKRFASRAS